MTRLLPEALVAHSAALCIARQSIDARRCRVTTAAWRATKTAKSSGSLCRGYTPVFPMKAVASEILCSHPGSPDGEMDAFGMSIGRHGQRANQLDGRALATSN